MLFSYILTLVSYFYTSLLDPGIIRASEDNSVENKNILEPLGYTYCSICGLYRPPNGYHCSDCGVCFYKYRLIHFITSSHDHHCTFMGQQLFIILITRRQCVAKNNLISFYLFIASLLVFLISLEVGAMTLFATKPEGIVRNINTLWLFLSTLMNKHHLRNSESLVCSMKSSLPYDPILSFHLLTNIRTGLSSQKQRYFVSQLQKIGATNNFGGCFQDGCVRKKRVVLFL